jgi:hypothetical protein
LKTVIPISPKSTILSPEINENLKTKVADKEKDHSLIKADNKSMENVQNKWKFVADSENEHHLDAQLFSEDCDHYLACCHCGRNFQTKADLMVHRKQEHEEKVNLANISLEEAVYWVIKLAGLPTQNQILTKHWQVKNAIILITDTNSCTAEN